MRKALLTGKYSSDTELVLTNSFAGRLRNVALMKFYQRLVDKGVAEWLDVGDPVPDLVGGKKAVRWEAKIPITDPNSGLTTMGIRNLAVQEHLMPEMKQLVGHRYAVQAEQVFPVCHGTATLPVGGCGSAREEHAQCAGSQSKRAWVSGTR